MCGYTFFFISFLLVTFHRQEYIFILLGPNYVIAVAMLS